ncbi:MAG: CrcB family protein, partial [Desulfovibrionaceae bacterium]|nr:CrcB family protein [Desulfovibrionaceae bacterium]
VFVNVLGSCIMGAVAAGITAGYFPAVPWRDFIAEGFLGALTTFSTFSMDTFTLYARGDMLGGSLNLLLNMIFCLAGVTLGVWVML